MSSAGGKACHTHFTRYSSRIKILRDAGIDLEDTNLCVVSNAVSCSRARAPRGRKRPLVADGHADTCSAGAVALADCYHVAVPEPGKRYHMDGDANPHAVCLADSGNVAAADDNAGADALAAVSEADSVAAAETALAGPDACAGSPIAAAADERADALARDAHGDGAAAADGCNGDAAKPLTPCSPPLQLLQSPLSAQDIFDSDTVSAVCSPVLSVRDCAASSASAARAQAVGADSVDISSSAYTRASSQARASSYILATGGDNSTRATVRTLMGTLFVRSSCPSSAVARILADMRAKCAMGISFPAPGFQSSLVTARLSDECRRCLNVIACSSELASGSSVSFSKWASFVCFCGGTSSDNVARVCDGVAGMHTCVVCVRTSCCLPLTVSCSGIIHGPVDVREGDIFIFPAGEPVTISVSHSCRRPSPCCIYACMAVEIVRSAPQGPILPADEPVARVLLRCIVDSLHSAGSILASMSAVELNELETATASDATLGLNAALCMLHTEIGRIVENIRDSAAFLSEAIASQRYHACTGEYFLSTMHTATVVRNTSEYVGSLMSMAAVYRSMLPRVCFQLESVRNGLAAAEAVLETVRYSATSFLQKTESPVANAPPRPLEPSGALYLEAAKSRLSALVDSANMCMTHIDGIYNAHEYTDASVAGIVSGARAVFSLSALLLDNAGTVQSRCQ